MSPNYNPMGDVADEHDIPPDSDAPSAPPWVTDLGKAWRPMPREWLTEHPPPRRWLLRHRDENGRQAAPGRGDGMLQLGNVGLFTSSGGVGKTSAVIELAVCVATRRRWFDTYEIGDEARGHVAVVLAEEDADELHRRMYSVARSLDLDESEIARVLERVVVLPLAGSSSSLALVGPDEVGAYAPTLALRELQARLEGREWSLVVLDPLSHFAPDAEASNQAATAMVQALGALTRAPGRPTVLVVHHTSKIARTNGTPDARGVTGLTDGARWWATLENAKDDEGGGAYFLQRKSNYSRPMQAPGLYLVRGDGRLRASSEGETRAREERVAASATARLEVDIDRVVDVLRSGAASSIDAIVKRAGMKLTHGRAAVREALGQGRIANEGTDRRPRFVVPSGRPARDS
jgi:RecA-family ATPase